MTPEKVSQYDDLFYSTVESALHPETNLTDVRFKKLPDLSGCPMQIYYTKGSSDPLTSTVSTLSLSQVCDFEDCKTEDEIPQVIQRLAYKYAGVYLYIINKVKARLPEGESVVASHWGKSSLGQSALGFKSFSDPTDSTKTTYCVYFNYFMGAIRFPKAAE